MKALAAVSIHQYERAAKSLSEYNRTLEMGWQILLQKHSQKLKQESIRPTQNTAIIVFGSDWGMCGQFNERIAEYTEKYLSHLSISDSNTLILSVGARISDRLMAMGHNCDASFNLPSSIVGITAIIQEIVLTLEEWRNSGKTDSNYSYLQSYCIGYSLSPYKITNLSFKCKVVAGFETARMGFFLSSYLHYERG